LQTPVSSSITLESSTGAVGFVSIELDDQAPLSPEAVRFNRPIVEVE